MKVEFLDDISDSGKYPQVVSNQLIRLYDFDTAEASKLRQAIEKVVIQEQQELSLNSLNFIVTINCTLTLCLCDEDIGLHTSDKTHFNCYLTEAGYENIINFMEPFCYSGQGGHQWLYELDNPIDFLFSPGGTW